MPKAASTFLQQVAFAKHPEINLLWEPGIPLYFELRDRCDQSDFNLKHFSQRLNDYLDSRQFPQGNTTVASFEGFCGPQLHCGCARQITQSLRQLVGRVPVLVVLRNPYRLLYSIWAQYVKEGGRLSLQDFLRQEDAPSRPADLQQGIYQRVEYASYLQLLADSFGRENVHVLLFEDFQNHFAQFMQEMFEVLGVDSSVEIPNQILWRSPNYRNANLFRQLNRWCCSKQNQGLLPYWVYLKYRLWFDRRVFPSRKWNPSQAVDVRRWLPDIARAKIQRSNRAVADWMRRELAELGYDLG